MNYLARIEAYLATHDLSAATFGRMAMGDPRYVHDLRKTGRRPRARTMARIEAVLARSPEPTPERLGRQLGAQCRRLFTGEADVIETRLADGRRYRIEVVE